MTTHVEAALAEYRDLYEVALTWVDGDPTRARALVESYFRGRTDRERIHGPKESPR